MCSSSSELSIASVPSMSMLSMANRRSGIEVHAPAVVMIHPIPRGNATDRSIRMNRVHGSWARCGTLSYARRFGNSFASSVPRVGVISASTKVDLPDSTMRDFRGDRFERSKRWLLAVAAGACLTQCSADFPEPRTTSHTKGDYVEVPYLPPAALVEVAGDPPDHTCVWYDGHWVWRGNKYVWKRGGWAQVDGDL